MLQPSPLQTTYTQYIGQAVAGMPATETGWDIDTKIFEETASPAEGLGFGLAVSQGDGDRGVRLGAPSGRIFVGITVRDVTLPNVTSGFTDKYQDTDNTAVMVRGDIWVAAEDAVNAGEAVYFNATTGAIGSSGGTLIDQARWMTSATAGNLAIVRLGQAAGNASGT